MHHYFTTSPNYNPKLVGGHWAKMHRKLEAKGLAH